MKNQKMIPITNAVMFAKVMQDSPYAVMEVNISVHVVPTTTRANEMPIDFTRAASLNAME